MSESSKRRAGLFVKLEQTFPEHPKVLDLSPEAFRLYVEGLCYSARLLSDGLLASSALRRMSDPYAASELVDAGLWHEHPDGYEIHNYLDWQQSRSEVEALSEARSRAGKASAEARAQQRAEQLVEHPVEQSGSNPPTDKNRSDENRSDLENTRDFDEFWKSYPRKVAKPKALTAYRSARKRASADAIADGLRPWLVYWSALPDKTFVPHPSTWLAGDRWNDPAPPPKAARNGAVSNTDVARDFIAGLEQS